MPFCTNSTFLYIVAAAVIVFVLAQSVFFLVRAYRRGKELGVATTLVPVDVLIALGAARIMYKKGWV